MPKTPVPEDYVNLKRAFLLAHNAAQTAEDIKAEILEHVHVDGKPVDINLNTIKNMIRGITKKPGLTGQQARAAADYLVAAYGKETPQKLYFEADQPDTLTIEIKLSHDQLDLWPRIAPRVVPRIREVINDEMRRLNREFAVRPS